MATVLTCWKEIAKYLGKGVRTVQRWERELGLPVRRTGNDGHKSCVLAIPEEIDAWVQSQHIQDRNAGSAEAEVEQLRMTVEALRAESAALRELVQLLQQSVSQNSPQNPRHIHLLPKVAKTKSHANQRARNTGALSRSSGSAE